jgi:tetratricopeptide (TPR) repeat protein
MVEFGIAVEKLGLMDTAVSAYLRFIFHFFGTKCVDNEVLISLAGFKCDKKSGAEILFNLDRIFFAVRKVVDLLLQRADGLQPSVALINVSVDYLQDVTMFMPMSSPDIPQFPADLALLLGVCQLRLGTEQDVETGLTILNPLLTNIERDETHTETTPGVESRRLSKSSGSLRGRSAVVDSSDSSDDEDEGDGGALGYGNSASIDVSQLVADSDPASDAAAELLSDTSFFLAKQRIRVAEEFATLGMTTRAEKQLGVVASRLRVITDAHSSFDYSKSRSGLINADTCNEVAVSLASLWRMLGNVYCFLAGREEHAYAAYSTAIRLNEHDVEALSKYAELTRLHYGYNSLDVFGLLSAHFFAVLHEFESSRQTKVAAATTTTGATVKSSSNRTGESSQSSAMDVEMNTSDASHLSGNDINASMPVFIGGNDSGDEGEDDEAGPLAEIDPLDERYALVQGQEGYDEGSTEVGKQSAEGDASRTLQQFDRNALQHEVFALIEWTYLFLECRDNDLLSYCSITVPLLEHWCFTASVASGIVDSSLQKRRNKVKAIVSMGDLVSTDSCVNYAAKVWLDETQNICGRFVSAICDYVHIEKLLGKPLLLEMATQAAEFMRQIGVNMSEGGRRGTAGELMMTKLSNELLHASTLMTLRRGNNNIKRTKYIGVAEREMDATTQQPVEEEDSEGSSSSSSDSDLEDEDEQTEGEKGSAKANKKQSGFLTKMSTRKRQLSSSGKRQRKNGLIRHTGVNGGLMFNDFKNAAILENADPFIIAAQHYSPSVQTAAAALFSAPMDVFYANQLFRFVVRESSMVETSTSSKYLEHALPVGRLHDLKQDSAVTCLLEGHETAADRRNNETLDRYLDAFCLDPTQPLTLLCLSSYLVMLANHSHIKHRHDVLVKGVMFMHRYIEVRRQQTLLNPPSKADTREFLSALGLQQETLFNLGRALHDIRLYNLAVDQYQAALALVDQHPSLAESELCLTREAAHNLVLIYRLSDASDLALEVMQKYLSF